MLQKISRICLFRNVLQNFQLKPIEKLKSSPILLQHIRGKKDDSTISSLFIPVPVKPNSDDINVGAELTGSLNKADLLKILTKFYQRKEMKQLLSDHGLDNYLQHQTYVSFRRYCLEAKTLPVDLHVVISDILQDVSPLGLYGRSKEDLRLKITT
ncbi:hypothetical protein AMK59_8664 [Oryctes borbonicus]|uniref:Suv3 N-terminal domain-containing protein n=1 Tax=Oryctes borbonicus TaxID=1629725 RepID=A0A0T6AYK0_9SCAR|nr:hypothetical protein AMK59_8664 [Oryctes borbonicus]